jgi:hypothetical protein
VSTLTEHSPLPSRADVRTLFEGLTGRTVDFTDGLPVTAGGATVTAVYTNNQLGTSALVVVDIAAAARLGGALGMVPKGGVDDAISGKELPETLHGNCYEVLNVLASVFNVPGAPHVKLYQMFGPGEVLPSDVQVLSAVLGSREDVAIDIAGYGPGNVSIVVC